MKQRAVVIHCVCVQDEVAYDQVFHQANFKDYTFKIRAKIDTYNVRLPTAPGFINISQAKLITQTGIQ